MTWQDEEKEKIISEQSEKELCIQKVAEFWNKILDANNKLDPVIRLSLESDKNDCPTFQSNDHFVTLTLDVRDPSIIYFTFPDILFIRYDIEKRELYGDAMKYKYEINESIIDLLLKSFYDEKRLKLKDISKSRRQDCFLATAVYGSYYATEVLVLRHFRDEILLNSLIGKFFVRFYYFISPPVADFISKRERLKEWVRVLLIDPVVKFIGYSRNNK